MKDLIKILKEKFPGFSFRFNEERGHLNVTINSGLYAALGTNKLWYLYQMEEGWSGEMLSAFGEIAKIVKEHEQNLS